MKKILTRLVAKHDVVKVVEMLADICLEQAEQANVARRPDKAAMWKCNHVELSMTSGSLYTPRVNV